MTTEPITLDVLFRAMTKGFAEVHVRFEHVDGRIDGLDKKLTARIDLVEKNLTERIDTVERNLTRQIDGIDKRLDDVERAFIPQRMKRVERHLKLPKYMHRPRRQTKLVMS